MEPFELLLHEEALEALRKTRGENRKQLNSLFSVLPTNPYLQSDGSYEDTKGRIVQQLQVRNYLIEYVIDDPMKEIKILELRKLCS
ncbi:MAG: hypothetical protein ACPGGJ_02035 [Coraliomargarita sp.]